VFNAANEAAVAAFIEKRVPFTRITDLVRDALDSIEAVPIRTLGDVMAADRAARRFVAAKVGGPNPRSRTAVAAEL
jgi:1-deoxy-D-xylulose-5-phosphate reductoisomerase